MMASIVPYTDAAMKIFGGLRFRVLNFMFEAFIELIWVRVEGQHIPQAHNLYGSRAEVFPFSALEGRKQNYELNFQESNI